MNVTREKNESAEIKKNILIVDDAEINRDMLRMVFDAAYTVLDACDGVEALEIVKRNPDAIAVIILDMIMPRMGGLELLGILKETKEYSDIPVIMLTGENDEQNELKALRGGAEDFISKPFNSLIIRQRVENIIAKQEVTDLRLENQVLKEVRNRLRHDDLTGICNKIAFYDSAKELIDAMPEKQFVVFRWNIEHFSIINDIHGWQEGDKILTLFAQALKKRCAGVGKCGRLESDHFAMIIPDDFFDWRHELNQMTDLSGIYDGETDVRLDMGIYVVDDRTLPVSRMCDRANYAIQSIKGNFSKRWAFYDSAIRESMIEEQDILNEMNRALAERQFKIYIQPQFNHENESMIGGEVLVRWVHPQKGVLPPARFIPLFERNSFIVILDEYVWEETCRLLSEDPVWSRNTLPLSVNMSRTDLYLPGLVGKLEELVSRYQLKKERLRLEITESLYAENPEQLIRAVKSLRDAGFIIEMDDFGSGFSSLNMLKEIPFDILKLDMRFLSGVKKNEKKSEAVLKSIVYLAYELDCEIIAEGVETKEQADYLFELGVRYVQGYYYSRPLPVEQCRKFMETVRIEENV
jgi:diguanylate cyclase (GGDEF)-like protein